MVFRIFGKGVMLANVILLSGSAFAQFVPGETSEVTYPSELTVGELLKHQEECFGALADDLGMQTQQRDVTNDGSHGLHVRTNEDEQAISLHLSYNRNRNFTLQHNYLWGMSPDYAATHELSEYLERVRYGVYLLKGLHLEFNIDPDDWFSGRVKLVASEGLASYEFTWGPSRFGEQEGPSRRVTALAILIPHEYEAQSQMLNSITGLAADVYLDGEEYASCLVDVGVE